MFSAFSLFVLADVSRMCDSGPRCRDDDVVVVRRERVDREGEREYERDRDRDEYEDVEYTPSV